MRLYANVAGEIIRFLQTEEEEDRYPDPPEGTAGFLEFDPESNHALAAALSESTDVWRLLGGVLYRDGQPVVINPDSTTTTERRQALALVQALKTFNGLDPATLTAAQRTAELWKAQKANNRLTLILGRLLLKEMAGE
jgi:hypothetical protein